MELIRGCVVNSDSRESFISIGFSVVIVGVVVLVRLDV